MGRDGAVGNDVAVHIGIEEDKDADGQGNQPFDDAEHGYRAFMCSMTGRMSGLKPRQRA